MEITVQEIAEVPEVKLLLELMKLSNLETYAHSISVANITYKLLQHIDNYTEDEKIEVIKGALLHDIGKLYMPFNLTQAPKALSKFEYDIVKSHALASYLIVKEVFSSIVKNICLQHHERPDGTGYALGSKFADIPMEALIVQVADIYDALTNERRYKKAYSTDDALIEMQKEVDEYKIDNGIFQMLKSIIDSGDIEKKF